jgi:hypothetical protein
MIMKAITNLLLIAALMSLSGSLFLRNAVALPGCTAQEIQIFQSYTQQVMQATYNLNLAYINQLNQEFLSRVSPGCIEAVTQYGQQQPYTPYGGGPYHEPQIYQEPGQIIMPGVGGFDSGGFVPFD